MTETGLAAKVATLADRLAGPELALLHGMAEALAAGASEPGGVLMRLVGMEPESVEPGHVRLRLAVGPHIHNPHGVLHGGVLYTAMDTSMGRAVMDLLPTGQTCATVEAKINYTGSVRDGVVEIDTRVVHKGSRILVLESRATSDAGRLVAIMTATFMVLP